MNRIFSICIFVLCFLILWAVCGYPVNWYYDTEPAMYASSEQEKPMMWLFTADWCGYCKKMQNDTFSDPSVSSLMEKFICVKLDFDKDRMFAVNCCNVQGVPTIIFYDLKGKIVERVVGYKSPSEFANILRSLLERTM